MNSSLQSRNIVVRGKRTSMRLEPEMWEGLLDISQLESLSINAICSEVDRTRHQSSLTSAMRVFVLSYYRGQISGDESPIIRALTHGQNRPPATPAKAVKKIDLEKSN
ncbi:MAG: ribbon-helix-helix domain-containing protein [Candidatus Symbiobacter sp.]|nr:ribbon-helix-helix domain-containing protein [Candidatus Symbiobacter sp.]